MSDSLPPHGLQPTRLLCLWNFSGKNTGAGCHVLLHQFPKSANNTWITTRTFKDNEWRYSSGRKHELPPLSVPHQHPHIRAGRNLRDYLVLPFQASAGDTGLIPGSGRSPGGGHGNPLQCSCLENPMDRGAWWATQSIGSHRVRHDRSRVQLGRTQLGRRESQDRQEGGFSH